jgi:hypothetical protein
MSIIRFSMVFPLLERVPLSHYVKRGASGDKLFSEFLCQGMKIVVLTNEFPLPPKVHGYRFTPASPLQQLELTAVTVFRRPEGGFACANGRGARFPGGGAMPPAWICVLAISSVMFPTP